MMQSNNSHILLSFLNTLWKRKIVIIISSILGIIFGIIISLGIPEKYLSTVVLITTNINNKKDNLGSLASMAGISLGNISNDEIFTPEVYPEILNSTPFILNIKNISVEDTDNKINENLVSYINYNQKKPWWNNIFNFFNNNQNNNQNDYCSDYKRYLMPEDVNLINFFKKHTTIHTDKKTGISVLEVRTQSPIVSAILADTIISYLDTYLINQRTKKAKEELEKSKMLYEQSKFDYYYAQNKLASFVDSNINVVSAKYKIKQNKLQNEVNTAYAIYDQMSQQVQMNKLKIQDNTSVLTIIQPAYPSLVPESPRKAIIIFAFLLLSIFISSSYILRKNIWKLIISNNIK